MRATATFALLKKHHRWGIGLALAALVALLVGGGCGGGGGGGSTASSSDVMTIPPIGPSELAVLIAAGDATSEAIGLAYQQARKIPDANLIRVPLGADGDSISENAFATLKAAIDARLPPGVQATLVTWSKPSRVVGSCAMSITSALAFGYDPRYCGGCAKTLASPYFDSSSHRPWSELRIRPSMMLGAATLADAQALIARGVAADATLGSGRAASGSAWLLRTSDGARSGRYPDFRALAASTVAGVTMHYVDNSAGAAGDVVAGQNDVMFYFTGLQRVPRITENRYRPGAVADHLTSFGGVLPDAAAGQMPATEWLQAGVTASYGTVEEPCAFDQKFPRASVLVNHYSQGEVLIEAYWKSVQWPGQGLFVGEPLAKPWAR